VNWWWLSEQLSAVVISPYWWCAHLSSNQPTLVLMPFVYHSMNLRLTISSLHCQASVETRSEQVFIASSASKTLKWDAYRYSIATDHRKTISISCYSSQLTEWGSRVSNLGKRTLNSMFASVILENCVAGFSMVCFWCVIIGNSPKITKIHDREITKYMIGESQHMPNQTNGEARENQWWLLRWL
jgi:hypothetical protein